MRRRYLLIAGLTVVIGLGAAGYHRFRPIPPDPRVLADDQADYSIDYSNILPADYVGPETCRECHPTHYSRWRRHPHSKMNRRPGGESVQGDFSDKRIDLPAGAVRFHNSNGKYFMSVFHSGNLYRRYVVTRTVGSRYMQFYIGKQLHGPESKGDAIYGEHMLPFAYWFKLKRWLPRQYFDNDGDESLMCGVPRVEALNLRPDVRPYSAECMNCHNTFSYAYRIFQPELVGFPDATIAAAVGPLSRALAPTLPVEPSPQAFAVMNARLDPDTHLVTLGISCESCHFGGREHAQHKKEIRFLPTSKFIRINEYQPKEKPLTSSRHNPATIVGICAQCHSGRGKRFPNGAAKTNSREALDMHAGFCTSELRCVSCHDPHRPSEKPSGGPTNPRHLQLCVKCHDQYATASQALAHSKHPPGANIDCMDCHMPRYSQGLDALVRTHRICNPVEEKMVAEGSANACNLCHLEKSTRWTLKQLAAGWGRRIKPKPSWPVFAKLDEPLGRLWLRGDDNHLRLVAVQSYARSSSGKKMLPELIRALNDPEPVNRVFAGCAVRKILGKSPHEPIDVNITATPEDRSVQIARWLNNIKLQQAAKIHVDRRFTHGGQGRPELP